MSYTLFILQTPFDRLDAAWQELQHIVQSYDKIILLEDSVFLLSHMQGTQENLAYSFYILDHDQHLISNHAIEYTMINYSEFAQLITHASQVITWK